MKKFLITVFIFIGGGAVAQELYVSTEPASNMATGSIGVRLNSRLFKNTRNQKFNSYRIEPEIMFGVNKNVMVHIAAYGSNMFQNYFRPEGASLYGKYRIYSQDEVHKHFRMAAYAKAALIKNPQVLLTREQHLVPDGNGGFIPREEEVYNQSNDIDLDGSNSGLATGIVATGLIDKLALSASLGYIYRMNNIGNKRQIFQARQAITYTASAGYLLFPREYTSYRQTNCNLYLEMLGQSFTDEKQYFIEAAPAVQFIFNSIARVDIVYRAQMTGNVNRLSKNYLMLRLEYNFLNVFGKR